MVRVIDFTGWHYLDFDFAGSNLDRSKVEYLIIYYNAIPGGAFRGFGVPQSTVIGEALLDELALASGSDPLEFRHRNALRAGDRTATGQLLSASVGLQACLDGLRPAWREARARAERFNADAAARGDSLRRGAGVACMWYGIGNTVIANPSTMTVGLVPGAATIGMAAPLLLLTLRLCCALGLLRLAGGCTARLEPRAVLLIALFERPQTPILHGPYLGR